jgi:hypothetical protein
MEASTSKDNSSNNTAPKHARLANLPPAGPSRLPTNHNDHHNEDEEEGASGESDFDESTIKTEGGLASKLDSLDERAFEDKKKVALKAEDNAVAIAEGRKEPDEVDDEEENDPGQSYQY